MGDDFGIVGGNDLVESFVFADHAQIGAGTFFGGFTAVLEIYYLGLKTYIAMTQCLVLAALLRNGVTQPAGLVKTVVRQP
jgi:hypothetical protein